ncbi:ISL3 family transposase [Bacillus shivajii]|uniref:ISL3 family transposase n=1 Tax=Bacillus shivajii TaxID=1983719 RepID=UPI001CFB02CF|nr:ISL3 family transposase [Bacillus shivajii]UCZ51650.1 ISL3 family transposase [Bacillus shivajii]UCZ51817.1 ISL3 family transposase [Bacillus shivajii]UCZ53339.1 ISL3 family transposase [Bacillus shivajii]UCZ54962.1 ISL3 family transposase [Bacillus shivajii]UCZ55166.1 ISL3 family transposase [Bacillus shivajii]
MQLDFITKLLGIKDKHVFVFDSGEEEQCFWFELHSEVRKQKCPKCKEKTKRIHGYRMQSIQGAQIAEKKVYLQLRKRRYRCMNCGHAFFEKLSFLDKYQRHTSMLAQEALSLCSEMSFTHAARISGMSTNRYLRLFDKRKITVNKVLPRAIAIDEFKGDAGKEKYQTVIVDVENRHIIDILPDRKVKTIENYFKECDTGKVEIVVIDLSKAFKEAVRRQLGSPLIIADRFHFMRHGYWAFDEVRRELQNELQKDPRIKLKRCKELLWKSPEKLDEKGKAKVEKLLQAHPQLRQAYEVKNALDQWFKQSTPENAKVGLEAWYTFVEESGIPSFQRVVKMFKRWQTEILQSFMYPYNNGYIEGVNNTTKVTKRMSYGIKSFERLRMKILWRQMVRSHAV